MKTLVIGGKWWFDISQTKSYSGKLSITNSDIDLELIDCDDYKEGFFNVFGFSEKGKKITLYKCFVTEHKRSRPGLPTLNLTANYYFEGEFLNENQLYFDSASFTFHSLDKWLDISGFTNEINPQDENGVIIKYTNLQSLTFFENENIKFSFEFEATWPFFITSHEIKLVQKTKIHIASKTKFNLSQLWVYLSQLRTFFTLAYYSQPILEELELLRDGQVITAKYVGEEEFIENKTHRRHFLFDYSVIKNNFDEIYEKWDSLTLQVEPILNILLELFSKRNITRENKFLNVIQAIETFHRRLRNNQILESREFMKKREEIINSSPEEYKTWLKERLAFANEPTLKQRLEELFQEIDPTIQKLLFPNLKQLIKLTKDSRNYYTHYDVSLSHKALRGRDLFILTERLKLLILILLLKETKIDQNKAYQIIKESSFYLFNHIVVQ